MARSQITPGTHGDVFSTPYTGEAGNRRPIPTADPCGVCKFCLSSGEGITFKCLSPVDRTRGKGKIIPTAWRARTKLRLPDGKLIDVERWDAAKTRAESAVRKACADRLAKDAAPQIARDGMTVIEAARAYAAQIRADSRDESLDPAARMAPRSVTLYVGTMQRHVEGSELADLPLVAVEAEDVTALLKKVARSAGVGTARTLRAVLSGIWKWARGEKVTKGNPVRDAELPNIGKKVTAKANLTTATGSSVVTVKRAHDRALSDAEIAALTEACKASTDRTVADLILVMLATAVRVGEACALRWSDVDLIDNTVTIDGTVSRVAGQGIVRGRPKTASSARTIPLSNVAAEILAARLQEAAAPVFPSAAGTYLDPSNVQKRIRAILDPIGLTWATPHTLRRTAITRIADRVPLRLVADLAGHSDPAMTARKYLGRKGESSALREAMNAL